MNARRVVLAIAALAGFVALTAGAAELGPIPSQRSAKDKSISRVDVFDLDAMKKRWRSRLQAVAASGVIPIIDIESSYNPKKLNPKRFAKTMDKYGVAMVAFSPQIGKKKYFKKGKVWNGNINRLIAIDPWRYIPVTTAGIYPAWTQDPDTFLDETITRVEEEDFPLMGEFEFRHYMSPRQYKRGDKFRDVSLAIDGPAGEKLFTFSARSGVPFQLHYEIEDVLLPPLEKMLKKYPDAIVIWCHLAQARYSKRNTIYGPAYVRNLIDTYPNIYFDLAFGGPDSFYPGSGEYHSRIWDRQSGMLKAQWVKLIADHPWRFLAAFDIGGDRMDWLPEKVHEIRRILKSLPEPVREIVAYKAAWRLLFNEKL